MVLRFWLATVARSEEKVHAFQSRFRPLHPECAQEKCSCRINLAWPVIFVCASLFINTPWRNSSSCLCHHASSRQRHYFVLVLF